MLIFTSSFSQSYFTAGGVRLGTDWGISFQQKIYKHLTAEVIFQSSFFREELMLTIIPEYHFPLVTKRLNLYLGAGFHKGFITSSDPVYQPPHGITTLAGAEITLAGFTVSYDFKPAFNLSGGENPWYSQTALSVRYVIIKQNAFKKMKRKRTRKKKKKERAKAHHKK
ncbi:MAG: hypothetical protein ABFS35_03545 [Bacteroidota bacterium]